MIADQLQTELQNQLQTDYKLRISKSYPSYLNYPNYLDYLAFLAGALTSTTSSRLKLLVLTLE